MELSHDLLQAKTVPLFKGFSNSQLLKILQLAFIKEYATGITLFHEVSHGDVMYVMLSGSAEVLTKDATLKERVVAKLEKGEFFGELALINDDVRTATVRITAPTRLLVITRRAFQHMLNTDPATTATILLEFLRILSQRLRKNL